MPDRVPPLGAAMDAGALEDSYVALFKVYDARAARIFEFAEPLVTAGKLTLAEVAKYANDLLGTGYIAWVFDGYFSEGFAADVLESANMAVSKAYNILKHPSLRAERTQAVLYAMELVTKLVDILTYGAADLTVSSDQGIGGVNRYGTLTVNAGITLTVTGQPGAIIAKTISNSGTILKSLTGGAAGARAVTGAGRGGQGAGGLTIFADSLGSSGLIRADGEAGESATTVAASGAGGAGGAGAFFRVGTDSAGMGGRGGDTSTFYGTGGVDGGGGGGCGAGIYSGGGGDGSTPTTFTYAELAARIRKSVIDWVIVNVLGKSPPTTQAIPNVYGSGGGGGAGYDAEGASGGGGGGGGELLALCVSLNNTGTIRSNAGDGGNGGTEGTRDACGGGGGGGLVYVFYKTLVSAGTLSAAGGVHGPTADHHGTDGGAGVATSQAV